MTISNRFRGLAAPTCGGYRPHLSSAALRRNLGLLLGLVGVLGACGDDGDETGDATPTASAGLSQTGTGTTGESEGTDSTDPTDTDATSEPTTGVPTTTDPGGTEPTTTGAPETESESDSACDRALWYLDADGDGYGDPDQVESACEAPPGYVDNDLDCDDQDPELHPETAWYLDADGDGYGDPDDVIYQCEEPPGRVRLAGDCDDQNPEIGPHVAEATCGDLGTDLNCDGEPAPLCASCLALLEDAGIAEDGVYTVDPTSGDPDDALAVYCDMTTEGGGWTLMMRITGSSTSHVFNNSQLGPSPCLPDGVSCRLSSAKITDFIAVPGLQILEIRPDNPTYIPWYVRAAEDTLVWPQNLECSNRPTLLASPTEAWVLTSYQSEENAFAGIAGDLGDYTGANHYYPTPYGPEQLFFKGSGTGLRVNTAWSSQCCTDNQPGTLWIR